MKSALALCCASLVLPSAALAQALTGTLPTSLKRKAELVYVEKVPGTFKPDPAGAVMNQRGNTYLPHVLPVVVGTKVSFKSEDPELHNVYARGEKKTLFNQAVLPKQSYDRVMSEPGMVKLSCNIHKEMSAFILVLQNPFFTTPKKATGDFRIDGLPAGKYTVRIWGEKLTDEERERRFVVSVGAGEAKVEFALR